MQLLDGTTTESIVMTPEWGALGFHVIYAHYARY